MNDLKDIKILKFDTLSSTNLYLKDNYPHLDDKTVVVANHQTAGRGRLGRTWIDSDDLLFSILLKNNLNEKVSSLSLLICASLFKTLKRYFNDVKIKWPNDILVNNKKILGILLEAITNSKIDCVIIGIGINVNNRNFTDDLIMKATSFSLETNKSFNKDTLLNEVLNDFFHEYDLYIYDKSDYLNICKENSWLINKIVTIKADGIRKTAIVKDILNNGNILLSVDSHDLELNYGEVTLEEVYK